MWITWSITQILGSSIMSKIQSDLDPIAWSGSKMLVYITIMRSRSWIMGPWQCCWLVQWIHLFAPTLLTSRPRETFGLISPNTWFSPTKLVRWVTLWPRECWAWRAFDSRLLHSDNLVIGESCKLWSAHLHFRPSINVFRIVDAYMPTSISNVLATRVLRPFEDNWCITILFHVLRLLMQNFR